MESSKLVHPRILVTREDGITLATLTTKGLDVPTRSGVAESVAFRTKRNPHEAREGSGWQQVVVLSEFGEESVLLYEPWEGGRVSGVVRLTKPIPRRGKR